MVLTTSGHIAIASAIKSQTLHLAWGDLPDFLSAPTVASAVVLTGQGSLQSGLYNYVVTAINNVGETTVSPVCEVTISEGASAVSLTWPSVTGAKGYRVYGRTPNSTYYLISEVTTTTFIDLGTSVGTTAAPSANTTSLETWTTTPPTPTTSYTSLCRELGRRKASIVKYVTPDDNGAYLTTQGRWSESSVPTKHIYVYVGFDLNDAVDSTIYQFGLFIGTVAITGYENALYLTPDLISSTGSLLALENVSPIYRNSSTREVHELVMTF